MFEDLSDKLSAAFQGISGKAKLTDVNIAETVREIRRALLDADVNYEVARDFTNKVKDEAMGSGVLTSVQPGQMFTKIIYDELVDVLGGEKVDINFSKNSLTVILIAGLQGSGKTTFVGKLAKYLKDNNRNDIGVLILAGGWIESIYMMTQIAQTKYNKEISTRIGEQKHPLDNLIKILSPYYNQSEEYGKFIDALIDLAYDFDGIDINYIYFTPTVDVKNKLTVINSKSELMMTDQQLKTVSDKISVIRKKIID